jgi:intein/homing endonuclease
VTYDIVVGRGESDRKKFGTKGTILIAKSYVKMGRTVSLSNKVYMDAIKAHVVFIVGKRGSGKSYSASVIAEGMVDLPDEVSKNLSIIMMDTMGVFWTMKYPNEKDMDLLELWGMEPRGLKKVKIFTPYGLFEETKNRGIPTDFPFSVKASELTGEDWRLAFELGGSHPVTIAIEKILSDLAEEKIFDYNLDDLIQRLEKEASFPVMVRNEAMNRLKAAKQWGLFAAEATGIDKLIQGGHVSVLDMSAYITGHGGHAVRALVMGLVARKIFAIRMRSRQLEEIEALKTGYSYFKMEEEVDSKDKEPLVWFFIDECIPGSEYVQTDKGAITMKQIIVKFEKGEGINVLSFDTLRGKYCFNPVIASFRKGEKQVIKLETEAGTGLRCTPDHKVKTILGFREAKEATEIAVPLRYNYRKEQCLIEARLLGYIFGDGYLSTKGNVVGFCGKGYKEDLEKIKEDLTELGFSSGNIYERETTSKIRQIDGKVVKVKGISQEVRSSIKCFRRFVELGAPIGQKIFSTMSVPDWVLQGSSEIKEEFLAALFAADGTAPSLASHSNKHCNSVRFSLNKLKIDQDKGLVYANQIVVLLNSLGIKTGKIRIRKGNIRACGRETVKIVLSINNQNENMVRFLGKVGYRYSKVKEIQSLQWLYYFRAKLEIARRENILKSQAMLMHIEQGKGKVRVARDLGVPVYKAREWIYRSEQNTRSPNSFPTFPDWIKDRKEGETLYLRVDFVNPSSSEPVFDITVKDTHNFVVNGMVVHNCHNFLPATGKTAATDALVTILREGRQPGLSLLLITQQPGKVHSDVLTQSDIVVAHRLTAKRDVDALNSMMQSYLGDTLTGYLNMLPAEPGAAIILDDNSERLIPLRMRPKFSWHGGEAPTAIKYKKSQNLGLD